MKRPTLLEGVSVAIAASATGGVFFSVLGSVLPTGSVSRLLITGFGLTYVIYLLSRSDERIGRITVLTTWLAASGTIWLLSPSLPLYLLLHVGMLWVIRSLYFYSSVLSSLADLGVNVLSLATTVWAALETGNAFLIIWCFFLSQALFVFIPAAIGPHESKHTNRNAGEDRFEQAYREAEAALRKYSSSTNL